MLSSPCEVLSEDVPLSACEVVPSVETVLSVPETAEEVVLVPPPAASAKAGQIAGQAVHPAGNHHDTHKDHEHTADFRGVSHSFTVLAEEIQQASREQAHRKKRDNKAQRIHADQQKSGGGGSGRRSHDQHRSQSGPHAGVQAKLNVKPSKRAVRGFIASLLRLNGSRCSWLSVLD